MKDLRWQDLTTWAKGAIAAARVFGACTVLSAQEVGVGRGLWWTVHWRLSMSTWSCTGGTKGLVVGSYPCFICSSVWTELFNEWTNEWVHTELLSLVQPFTIAPVQPIHSLRNDRHEFKNHYNTDKGAYVIREVLAKFRKERWPSKWECRGQGQFQRRWGELGLEWYKCFIGNTCFNNKREEAGNLKRKYYIPRDEKSMR